MNVELYDGQDTFYQYSKKEIIGMTRGVVGPYPVVVDNGQIVAQQPWDPNTDEAWSSNEEAIAWGEKLIEVMTTPIEPAPQPQAPLDPVILAQIINEYNLRTGQGTAPTI